MSLTLVHCRVCGKSDGVADGPTLEFTNSTYCGTCKHRHNSEHKLRYCSIECLQKDLAENRKSIDEEVAAFKDGTLWRYLEDRMRD